MRTEDGHYHLRGRLFAFEGSGGVGKSTVAKSVAEELRKKGAEVLFLSFPGHGPNSQGKLAYDLHLDKRSFGLDRISPTSLQVLHVAAHIDCVEKQILPALTMGKTIILNRYWWSTVAYGLASGIPRDTLHAMVELEKAAWGKVKPDLLFLITREEPFRAELLPDQWTIVCSAYQQLVLEEKDRQLVSVIQNSKPLLEVVSKVIAGICDLAPEKESLKLRQEPLGFQPKSKIRACKRDRWAPTKTTEVFNTYWYFAAERQSIFFNRLRGGSQPWTRDPILKNYKFTNAYRASDRTSQFLIRNVIYAGEQNTTELIFRILLFKTFNKIDTWNLLLKELGSVSWREFDFRIYDRILTEAQSSKKCIYSAAYIMPSGGSSFGHAAKHRNHLALLQRMMEDELPDRIINSKSMQEVFELLRAYPMIGDFLAYQYATDINYSTVTNFSESSFVVPGPGAKDGIRKCFSDFGGLGETDLIKLMADRQQEEFARLGLHFQSLCGRQLQLIDCQNLFCEVDKYARVAHPEVKGLTGRNRIKQKFSPIFNQIQYFYPPKWNINQEIKKILKK
jgi:thymidylate kinase